MESHRDPLYINDFHNSSKLFEFHLFADDANLFYEHKSLQQLQENINSELINIHTWLCANKLSLNIEKSNFILFHSPQKKLQDSYFNLNLCRIEKELLKIISSGFDGTVFKSLRMSTDILKGPVDLPDFNLEISSSISLEVGES